MDVLCLPLKPGMAHGGQGMAIWLKAERNPNNNSQTFWAECFAHR
jgi:hypothetical protein